MISRFRVILIGLLVAVALLGVSPTPTYAEAVILAAGDIATCSGSADEETAKIIEKIGGEVLALGDNVYPSGTAENYKDCYDPTWGKFKDRTHPALGNHDYVKGNANAYFDYFGERAGVRGKGYYSFNYGGWHIVILNSNPIRALLDEQIDWLRADLAANPVACVLAVAHHPRFSTGAYGMTTYSQGFFKILYDAGADILLSGDAHHYERFAPADTRGNPAPGRGVRQFVVGTGGAYTTPLGAAWRITETRYVGHGVLKLSLRDGSYAWEYLTVPGKSTFTDTGAASCVSNAPTP